VAPVAERSVGHGLCDVRGESARGSRSPFKPKLTRVPWHFKLAMSRASFFFHGNFHGVRVEPHQAAERTWAVRGQGQAAQVRSTGAHWHARTRLGPC
jgi:hypothetical protein